MTSLSSGRVNICLNSLHVLMRAWNDGHGVTADRRERMTVFLSIRRMPSEGAIDGIGAALRFPATTAENLVFSSNFIDGALGFIAVEGREGSGRSLPFGEIGIT